MVNSFSPEMMHQLTVLASNNETSSNDGSAHVSTLLNDFGSRLHLEAEVKKQKLDKMKELGEFERREEEMMGCTFKPSLNKNSRDMGNGRGGKVRRKDGWSETTV